ARRLAAVVPDGGVVPLNTVYGIATRSRDDAYALAALFNSRWLTALARLYADPARGGFRRFNARVVRGLPIPPADAAVWRHLADPRRRPARRRRRPRQVVRRARSRPRARGAVHAGRPGGAGGPVAGAAQRARGRGTYLHA